MISALLENLYAFALSIPINMLILAIICLIMVIGFKKSVKDCVKVIICYLLLGLLLAIFGITMPKFTTAFEWIKTNAIALWEKIW